MDPGLLATTRASRQKSRVAITAVKTKNQKNARKDCGRSAATSIEVHARAWDQTHSAPPTAATAFSHFSRLKIGQRTYETAHLASAGGSGQVWLRMGARISCTSARSPKSGLSPSQRTSSLSFFGLLV